MAGETKLSTEDNLHKSRSNYVFIDQPPFNLDMTSFLDHIVFQVKASNDAHITLAPDLNNGVEVVIGGWGGLKNVIRSQWGAEHLTETNSSELSDKEFRPFWLSWLDGVVSLGKGLEAGADEIVSVTIPNMAPVKHIAIATGWGSSGEWIINTDEKPIQPIIPSPTPDPTQKEEKCETCGGTDHSKKDCPKDTQALYYDLRSKLLKSGQLYEDPDFQPSPKILMYSDRDDTSIQWLRPKEINPTSKFVTDGMTQFDIGQGSLGDCWFLAATASLTQNKELLKRTVPQDQDMQENYCGAFRFVFWRYDKFEEVIIDDRLPTRNKMLIYSFSNRDETWYDDRELWVPLLEKAYAKLHGGYETLSGGYVDSALEDMTGGITETLNRMMLPKDFFDVLEKTSRMNSIVGLSCEPSDDEKLNQEILSKGLKLWHAYSVTKVTKVKSTDGKEVKLVRVRNPHAHTEWKGAWSDNSEEWASLPDSVKDTMAYRWFEDGEFWMSCDDVMKYFTWWHFCHLYPDALTKEISMDNKKDNWNCQKLHGTLIKNAKDDECKDCELQCHLSQSDDKDGLCTIIVSLRVKDHRRTSRLENIQAVANFTIYDITDGGRRLYKTSKINERLPGYMVPNLTDHLRVLPGDYAIVPKLLDGPAEAGFLLRVFTEKQTN